MLISRSRVAWVIFGLSCALITSSTVAAADGAETYKQRCAACHDNPVERVPPRDTMRNMTPETIAAALTRGVMRPQAEGLSGDDIQAVAVFLSGKPFGGALAEQPKPNPCKQPATALRLQERDWNGWGRDLQNTRFQPNPGVKASDVPRLKVKWAYTYPGRSTYGQPSIVGNLVFVSSSIGRISALDVHTGCEYWTYEAGAAVRSPITVGALPKGSEAKFAAYFGDEKAFAHAVDAQTGKALWKIQLDQHVVARITGPTKLFEGRLYVPVSSVEESMGGRNAQYACCTFRGSVAALDAATGQLLWKSFTIVGEPRIFKTNSAGIEMIGPAGAAIWSSPTIDAKRRLLYVGTGNAYTEVEDEGANSIQAFDLATGARKWINHVTLKDSFIMGCGPAKAGVGNCPGTLGPDADFGSPPLLHTLPNGKQIIIASQKSGRVYGLDPDNQGRLLWQTQVGHGGPLGGIEHGPAADARRVYVAVSDAGVRNDARPGMYGLDPATGEILWSVPTPTVTCSWGTERCGRSQAAAVTAIPGVAFSGAFDGHIRAYDSNNGTIIWDYDTAQEFATVNGVASKGGTIDFGGTTIANGVVYVNSGYGAWGMMGHVLLAFTVDGK